MVLIYPRLVIMESSIFCKIWVSIINVMLIYVSTVYIYRLSFVELRIEVNLADEEERFSLDKRDVWFFLDNIMNACFWADLVVSFFFTYRDSYRQEAYWQLSSHFSF